jgi:hypothetical protein
VLILALLFIRAIAGYLEPKRNGIPVICTIEANNVEVEFAKRFTISIIARTIAPKELDVYWS